MSKTILVTGSNSGIGFELVRLLAQKGHNVYLSARKEQAGEEAQAKLREEGFNVKFVKLDVTDITSVNAAKDAIEKADGHLDVLVNNAGVGNFDKNQNATSVSLDLVRTTFETNFFGLIQTTTTFLPLIRASKNGGAIVNVTSDLASNTIQAKPDSGNHYVAYNSSKIAVNAYTIALAHELSEEDIKVNTVTPGLTSTKMVFFGEGLKSARAGAEVLVPWVLLNKDGKTGLFINEKGEEFPW